MVQFPNTVQLKKIMQKIINFKIQQQKAKEEDNYRLKTKAQGREGHRMDRDSAIAANIKIVFKRRNKTKVGNVKQKCTQNVNSVQILNVNVRSLAGKAANQQRKSLWSQEDAGQCNEQEIKGAKAKWRRLTALAQKTHSRNPEQSFSTVALFYFNSRHDSSPGDDDHFCLCFSPSWMPLHIIVCFSGSFLVLFVVKKYQEMGKKRQIEAAPTKHWFYYYQYWML